MYVCAQDVASVKDTAAQAVTEFIRSPDLFQFDLFESPTITQLKGDSQHGHLYQLLEIVLNGNLQVNTFSFCFRTMLLCAPVTQVKDQVPDNKAKRKAISKEAVQTNHQLTLCQQPAASVCTVLLCAPVRQIKSQVR